MKKTTIVLAALALTAGGCGGGEPSAEEEKPVMTGEETVLSPDELNDQEGKGEVPEKEPAKQDN